MAVSYWGYTSDILAQIGNETRQDNGGFLLGLRIRYSGADRQRNKTGGAEIFWRQDWIGGIGGDNRNRPVKVFCTKAT
jgi:hypothetical protein